MYPKNILLVFCNYLIILELLIISSSIISSVNAADEQYDDCAPVNKSSCGFQWKIAYPFWDSRQPDYCGHPAFKLGCVNDTALTITIEKQTYNILNINYETKALTVLKPQFAESACPETKDLLTNTSLDTKVLSYTSNTENSTLLYDCEATPLAGDRPYAFTCATSSYSNPDSAFANELAYMAINQTSVHTLLAHCSFHINVPILKSAAEGLINGDTTIANTLNKGFEVKWLVDANDQCKDCTGSGGRCGYNQTLNEPVCFCKQGVYDRVCGKPQVSSHPDEMSFAEAPRLPTAPKKSNKLAIAIVVGIVGCVLLSCLLCICLYRRHRKKNAAVHVLSSNKSYDLSSGGSSTHFLTGSTYFGVHVFNYRELEVATEYFNPSRELGEGGFGTVYYGKLQDGREVAIKRLYENNSKRAEQFLNEVEILANLRHKNLVNLYGCTSRQSRELLLVYEFVPNGTVADHLHGKQSKVRLLPWPTRLSIATQTASALVYLHDSDIIHRDVKTQNVLLDNDFTVKVADFGLSRLFPLDVTHVSTAPQGTPGYVDPEYHQCYQLTEKSDVYSFGVMLAELISSLPAVDITRKRNEINLSTMAINKISSYALHEFVDPSLGFESDLKVKKEIIAVAELCFQCLQCTKEMRPTMIELLKRLLVIQGQQGSILNSAEVVDIPADDVLMLRGDFSPPSPPREDNFATRYKTNASA